MRSKAIAYLLGVVAIFAGVALLAFIPSRWVDLFGGVAVLCGLGATAWASQGVRLLKMYVVALLIGALIGGSIVLWRS